MKPGDLVSVHLRRPREWVRVPCSADGWETHEYFDLRAGDKGVVVKKLSTQYEVLFAGHVCLMWESQVRPVE
jgi:hypothetical protein